MNWLDDPSQAPGLAKSDQPTPGICPDCGKPPHNPATGFCWKSLSKKAGFHCVNCCSIRRAT